MPYYENYHNTPAQLATLAALFGVIATSIAYVAAMKACRLQSLYVKH